LTQTLRFCKKLALVPSERSRPMRSLLRNFNWHFSDTASCTLTPRSLSLYRKYWRSLAPTPRRPRSRWNDLWKNLRPREKGAQVKATVWLDWIGYHGFTRTTMKKLRQRVKGWSQYEKYASNSSDLFDKCNIGDIILFADYGYEFPKLSANRCRDKTGPIITPDGKYFIAYERISKANPRIDEILDICRKAGILTRRKRSLKLRKARRLSPRQSETLLSCMRVPEKTIRSLT